MGQLVSIAVVGSATKIYQALKKNKETAKEATAIAVVSLALTMVVCFAIYYNYAANSYQQVKNDEIPEIPNNNFDLESNTNKGKNTNQANTSSIIKM